MANPQLQSIFPSLDGSQLAAIIADPYLESKEDARVPEEDAKSTWRQMCDLQDFREPQVWMAGLVELWVTGLNVFASGAAGIALGSQKNVISPFLLPMIGGIIGALTLPLFIFAALPASGGHINPLITLGAFAIRALSLPRTIVYIVGQTVGGTVGAALLRVALGDKAVASAFIPGCTWSPNKSISLLQAFTLESVACAILLWVSFAAGLDPRQGGVFGRVLGPVVIGLTLGVTIFITGIAKPGYSGASMNPARCFGLLAATGNLENHFIHWAGPLTAALASGLAYLAMPPYKSEMTVPEIKGDVVLPRV